MLAIGYFPFQIACLIQRLFCFAIPGPLLKEARRCWCCVPVIFVGKNTINNEIHPAVSHHFLIPYS